MDVRKALMQQIKLLKVNAETKSQLAEMVGELAAEVYTAAWDDGYAAALEEIR
jgi:hypothetical protein